MRHSHFCLYYIQDLHPFRSSFSFITSQPFKVFPPGSQEILGFVILQPTSDFLSSSVLLSLNIWGSQYQHIGDCSLVIKHLYVIRVCPTHNLLNFSSYYLLLLYDDFRSFILCLILYSLLLGQVVHLSCHLAFFCYLNT